MVRRNLLEEGGFATHMRDDVNCPLVELLRGKALSLYLHLIAYIAVVASYKILSMFCMNVSCLPCIVKDIPYSVMVFC